MRAAPIVTARQPSAWQRLRRGVLRLGWLTLAGLLLAGIVHLVTVLLLPSLARQDAAHAYLGLGSEGHADMPGSLAPGSLPALQEADPRVVTAICAYDLTGGPVRITARAGSLPMAITLHRSGGGVVYAITDRAAIRGLLEFQLLTDEQNDERLAQDDDGEASRELRVVADSARGLVVVRVLAKQPSDRLDAEALATGVQCGPAG